MSAYGSLAHGIDRLRRDLSNDALDQGLAEAHVLASAFIKAIHHSRDVADDRNIAFHETVALSRMLDLATSLDLDTFLYRALGRHTSDLANAQDYAHGLIRNLLYALDQAWLFATEGSVAIDLALERAVQRVDDLVGQLELLDVPGEAVKLPVAAPEPAATSRSAEHLVARMMRLLPAQHRGRYAEELNAELYDLAQAKATGAMQVIYALQQLGRVWELRAALRAPDQSRFRRLHRVACWALASEWRTWGLLGPLLAFGVINVNLSQGWGSALFTLPGIVSFYAGVEWLRRRWGVEVKRRNKAAGDQSNE